MNEYDKEKDILVGLEQAEKVLGNKRLDWTDTSEVKLLRSESRVKERKVVLDRIILSRVCPSCRRKIILDSHWVIEKNLAWCRSCFHSSHKKEEGEISGSIIKEVLVRVHFDGWRIKTLRYNAGVGALAFAKKCGWTAGYQEQIERNSMKSLSLDSITIIMEVFEDIGVIITDSI